MLQIGMSPQQQFTFGNISPHLQFAFSPQRNLYQALKSLFESTLKAAFLLCRPAILHVKEQGIISS